MTATQHALDITAAAARAAAGKLARDIVAFDVSDRLVITDVFLVCSAANDRQVRAVVDAVQEQLLDLGAKAVRREGEREGRWVLLDFSDVVVHVQHQDERAFYALERIWRDCPALPLPDVDAGDPGGSGGGSDGGPDGGGGR